MSYIPSGRTSGKVRLRDLEIATHVAEYHASTDPAERRLIERTFQKWFEYHARRGCPLAAELLTDPHWMRRFPVLTFNNFRTAEVDFIQRRLAVPDHLTDERDIFWRVRTNAVDEVAQYLDAAFKEAVGWEFELERSFLLDALMTVAKRDKWSHSVCRRDQDFWARDGGHAVGSAAGFCLTCWWKCFGELERHFYTRRYAILEVTEALKGRPLGDAHRYRKPAMLDALFRQVPDVELYLREEARRGLSPR